MIFCSAMAVSWALVFADRAANSTVLQPQAFECFAEKVVCEIAARAANNAFIISGFGGVRRADCIEQPAGKQNWMAPFGVPK